MEVSVDTAVGFALRTAERLHWRLRVRGDKISSRQYVQVNAIKTPHQPGEEAPRAPPPTSRWRAWTGFGVVLCA